jgi:hypothetical protein
MFGGCSVVGQKSLNIGETPSVDGEQLLDRKTVAVLVSILLALFLYSMTPKLESIYIIVVPSPINTPSPSQNPSPSPTPSPKPLPTPSPIISEPKYQVTLIKVIYQNNSLIHNNNTITWIVMNKGTTPVYNVKITLGSTFRSGNGVKVIDKIDSGELYTCVMDKVWWGSSNVTCRIDWTTNSNVFIHTTQWFLVV